MIKGSQSALMREEKTGKLVPTIPPDSVRCIRTSIGLSPEQLADKLAVTGRTIYAWESEKNSRSCTGPGRILLQQIANKIKKSQVPEDLVAEFWVEVDTPYVIGEESNKASLKEALDHFA